MKSVFPGVYAAGKSLVTLSADAGRKVYNERLIKDGGREYRIWDPFRSKLCGAMHKGLKTFPFAPGSKVLYLGASTGTTISHLSDVMGPEGRPRRNYLLGGPNPPGGVEIDAILRQERPGSEATIR